MYYGWGLSVYLWDKILWVREEFCSVSFEKCSAFSLYERPKRTTMTTWYSNKQMRDLSHSSLFSPGVESKTL